MALMGRIESRSVRGRLTYALITLLLAVGGATMVYPFLIMVSGSLRSDMDQHDGDLIPAYLHDDDQLYRKFLETKYNGRIADLNRSHIRNHFLFADIQPPKPDPVSPPETAEAVTPSDLLTQRLAAYLRDDDLPEHWRSLGGLYSIDSLPTGLRELRRRASNRVNGDLSILARESGTPLGYWSAVAIPPAQWTDRRYIPPEGTLARVAAEMLDQAPAGRIIPVSLTGDFLARIIYPRYGQLDTNRYNEAHALPLDRFADFRLPDKVPDQSQPTLRAEWIEYVTQELHPAFVIVEGTPFSGRHYPRGQARLDHARAIEAAEPERLRLVGPEFDFGPRLFDVLPRIEWEHATTHADELRWAYATRGYVHVFDELVLQGPILFNTAVFCTLAIALALLINPLAAYAMSRFQMPATYKVLLFLMATMAFPPMVTLIPQFILLRELHLLNTFAALVIPLIANGYMVFLLKGFFDSLPRELYEAATIDGAGEIHMFFQITLALSKPILAVLALGTFAAAYTMFLYALLVAPDRDMWLISVWLYQFQQTAGPASVYASIIVASIPTLVIFLIAQRTIMRGIVVPTEK